MRTHEDCLTGCEPGHGAHNGASSGFSEEGVDDGVEHMAITGIHLAQAALQVDAAYAERRLCDRQCQLTLPWLHLALFGTCMATAGCKI